jgi:hypothetical protein
VLCRTSATPSLALEQPLIIHQRPSRQPHLPSSLDSSQQPSSQSRSNTTSMPIITPQSHPAQLETHSSSSHPGPSQPVALEQWPPALPQQPLQAPPPASASLLPTKPPRLPQQSATPMGSRSMPVCRPMPWSTSPPTVTQQGAQASSMTAVHDVVNPLQVNQHSQQKRRGSRHGGSQACMGHLADGAAVQPARSTLPTIGRQAQ